MNSIILSTATRVMAPILFLFAIYILWRGHNAPGGGFIGGLVAATALALMEKASGLEKARRFLRAEPLAIAAVGLACAVTAAVWGYLAEGSVLAGVWPLKDAYFFGVSLKPFGSILLFDTGVFLVVVGGVSGMLFTLEAAALSALDDADDEEKR
ncbi:MAG: MnhB domain-containing protein [Pseudomonadota bacterium]